MVTYYSKAYLSTQVNTAGRLDLIVALYEKTITDVSRAMKAITTGNDKVRADAIQSAADILMGLTESLDFTEPGGLAGRLFALYHYQLHMLLEANRTGDIEPLQSVKTTLNILLNGWRQASVTEAAHEIRREDMNRARVRCPASGPASGHTSFGMMA